MFWGMKAKVIIWGLGQALNNRIESISLDNVVCFIDSAYEDRLFMGISVKKPNALASIDYDYLVISSNKYFDEISQKCIFEYAVPIRKIIRIDYYLKLLVGKDTDTRYTLDENYLNDIVYGRINARSMKNLVLANGNGSMFVPNPINYRGVLHSSNVECSGVRIFQVTHKNFAPINDLKYEVISVGSKCTMECLDSSYGDNIDKYNAQINECSALYWIWKNIDDEYIGFNHYRRVFESRINKGWPAQVEELIALMQGDTIIVARPYITGEDSIRERLATDVCEKAFVRGISSLDKIFDKKSQEEQEAYQIVFEGNMIYPCNMFFMRKTFMNQYCEWLFDIIFRLLDEVKIEEYWDNYSKRIIGFIAERLFTVWLYYTDKKLIDIPMVIIGDAIPYGKE